MSGKPPGARRKASMTDVAALAGVSVMTVSNVINRSEIVSEATRAKVHAAMRELRYRNNLVARSLRLAQPRQIGYVLPARNAVGNEYMDAFLHDLAAGCQAADRNLTLITEQDTESLMDACEDLYFGQSVAGFIISNVESDDPRPLELRERGIPFAAYGRTGEAFASTWSWAEGDAALGIALAVDHLVERGHRELAFVGADPSSVTMAQRELGYREACLRHGLTGSTAESRIVACGSDLASGVRAAANLLDRVFEASLLGCDPDGTPDHGNPHALASNAAVSPPSAIVCVSDTVAAGAVITLQSRGLVPGRDVAVTGYDDTPLTSFGAVGITSIRQASAAIAAELVRLIIDRPDTPEHLLLPPALVVRSSTDPAS